MFCMSKITLSATKSLHFPHQLLPDSHHSEGVEVAVV